MKSPLLGTLIFRRPFSNLSFHHRRIGVIGDGKIHFGAFFESGLASCINISVRLQATAACMHQPGIRNLEIKTPQSSNSRHHEPQDSYTKIDFTLIQSHQTKASNHSVATHKAVNSTFEV